MYKYGAKSNRQRRSLHPLLQLIFLKVLLVHDHSLDQGGRTWGRQLYLYNAKPQRTKLKPPAGRHLLRKDPTGMVKTLCSFAVDTTPWIEGRPLATNAKRFGPAQKAQFAWFLGIVATIGREVLEGTGWRLRFGVNWDEDEVILTDQKFNDWFHVEMVRDD